MATQREQELYFEARNRALERLIPDNTGNNGRFMDELTEAFRDGIMAATFPNQFETQDFTRIKTETNYGFAFICGVLAKLEAVKGKHYAGSWQKRGEPVVLSNVQRKLDRLDQLLNTDSTAGENLSQTLGDGAVYSVKWLTLRAELDPEEFIKWVEEVRNL